MTNERDKSALLRRTDSDRAFLLQGIADGLRFSMDFLEAEITRLMAEEKE